MYTIETAGKNQILYNLHLFSTVSVFVRFYNVSQNPTCDISRFNFPLIVPEE